MFRLSRRRSWIVRSALALAFSAPLSLAHAGSFKRLYSFTGQKDGGYPGYGSLVRDAKGNLYGTTQAINGYTDGTVFELAPDGTETVLYTFEDEAAGFGPEALVRDSKGNLWGTACCGGGYGAGVVFELKPDGKESIIHDFAGPTGDGGTPYSALLIGKGGDFYGTTAEGGEYYSGTVFRLRPGGKETILHSFKNGRDGRNAFPGLIADSKGNMYGTTVEGGGKSSSGTVFEITPAGAKTLLYAFRGAPKDGELPTGGVVMDAAGNLYGITFAGGLSGCSWTGQEGCGTVFKLAPDGKETILHFFTGRHGDGGNPVTGLTLDSAGNLYGTTEYGGSRCSVTQHGCGTVFEIAQDGTETILHSFKTDDGAELQTRLTLDGSGNLYGGAIAGGKYGYGTIFEITP